RKPKEPEAPVPAPAKRTRKKVAA
ncbi:MAG: MucR family transcriptional regulator, partial [Mesorhizobium sp.]